MIEHKLSISTLLMLKFSPSSDPLHPDRDCVWPYYKKHMEALFKEVQKRLKNKVHIQYTQLLGNELLSD